MRARAVNGIAERKRQGLSIQAISSVTDFDRETVHEYLLTPDVIPVYGPQPAVVRRIETPPGRQGQVDWGHLGSLELCSIERPLWGLTFTWATVG